MSNLFKINWSDFWRGLLLAVIVAILGFLSEFFKVPVLDSTGVLGATIIAFVSYLLKNFITDKNGRLLGL